MSVVALDDDDDGDDDEKDDVWVANVGGVRGKICEGPT